VRKLLKLSGKTALFLQCNDTVIRKIVSVALLFHPDTGTGRLRIVAELTNKTTRVHWCKLFMETQGALREKLSMQELSTCRMV